MEPHHHHHHSHYHPPPHGPPHYHHHHHQHPRQAIPPTDDEFLAYDLPRLVQSLRYQRQQQQHTQQPPQWNFLNEPLADDLLFSGIANRQVVPPLHGCDFPAWAQTHHDNAHITGLHQAHTHPQHPVGLGGFGGGPLQHPFSAGEVGGAPLGLHQHPHNAGLMLQAQRSMWDTRGYHGQGLGGMYPQHGGGGLDLGLMNSSGARLGTGAEGGWGLGGGRQGRAEEWEDNAAAISAIREDLQRREPAMDTPSTQRSQGGSQPPSNPPSGQVGPALKPPQVIPPTISTNRREAVQPAQSRTKGTPPSSGQTPQNSKQDWNRSPKRSAPPAAVPSKKGKNDNVAIRSQAEHPSSGVHYKAAPPSHLNRATTNTPESFFKFPEPISFKESIVFGEALDGEEPDDGGKPAKDAGTRLRAYLKSAARLRQYLYTRWEVQCRLSDEEIGEIENLMRPVDEIQLEAMVDLDFQELCFMEEMHLKQAEVLSKFLEMAAVPGCIARRSGEILNANKAFMVMVGVTKETVETTNYFQLVHPRDLMGFSRDILVYVSKPGLPFQLIRDTTLRNLEDSREITVRVCISVHCDIYNMPALFVMLHLPFPGTPIPDDTPITVY